MINSDYSTRLIVLMLLVALSACGGGASLLRSSPPVSEPTAHAGLRYYMPRDLLRVEVTATYTLSTDFLVSELFDSACSTAPSKRTLKSVTTEVAQSTVADRRTAFFLTTESSWRAAQKLKLGLSNEGLLSSLNYSVEDKRAEIAGNVLRSVAGIAGAALGAPQLLAVPSGEKAAARLVPPPRTRGERCARLKDQAGMDSLLVDRSSLERDLRVAQQERQKSFAISARVGVTQAKALQLHDALQSKRLDITEKRLATVRETISASVNKAQSDAGVGSRDTVVKVDALVDLSSIPDDGVISGKLANLATVISALSGYPDLRRVAEAGRVVITLSSVPGGQNSNLPQSQRTWSSGDCPDTNSSDKCVHIYTRLAQPSVLRVYAPTGGAVTDGFAMRESKLLSTVSSIDPIIDVPIATSTLGQSDIALAFGRPGTLTGFEQNSTAGLASASATIATALTAARTEFVAGLKDAQTTQTTRDAMYAEGRAQQLKALQDQKARFDAEIALQSTTASRDLILQKQQIDAQIALLNSQQAYSTAQQTNSVSGDLADLKAQILRLQAQIDLLKVQAELAKAKKDAPTP